MITLAIKTSSEVSEFYLLSDEQIVQKDVWESGRGLAKGILMRIVGLLHSSNLELSSLEGIVVYGGPGSFTSLRIGVSTANALSYSLGIPIVKTSSDAWIAIGSNKLKLGEDDKVVLPDYGAEPHITAQKK